MSALTKMQILRRNITPIFSSKMRKLAKYKVPQWEITAGDNVKIEHGEFAGQSGKVVKVIRKNNQIIVDGVNLRTKYDIKGKIIKKPQPISYFFARLIEPTSGEPVDAKSGFVMENDKFKKIRQDKVSKKVIEKPKRKSYQERVKKRCDTILCTNKELVTNISFQGIDEEFIKSIVDKEFEKAKNIEVRL